MNSSRYHSIFEFPYDVVIFGAGYAGLGAARALTARGENVLVVESGGSLLWESTLGLENSAGTSRDPGPWHEWLGEFSAAATSDLPGFDPVLAEIHAAKFFHPDRPRLHRLDVLLYAMPVALESGETTVSAVTVATKSGRRRISGASWIDTTDSGLLARLVQPEISLRVPSEVRHSLILQTTIPDRLQLAVETLRGEEPDRNLRASFSPCEVRLTWLESPAPRHRRIPALLGALRCHLGPEENPRVVVSQSSVLGFPSFEAPQIPLPLSALPANVRILCPGQAAVSLSTPGDRFLFGYYGVGEGQKRAPGAWTLVSPNSRIVSCEVVVAGTGTAGAVAAIAAARGGAQTLAVDAAALPGGIGTGGGITGYFLGAHGGSVQDQIDDRSRLLTGLMKGVTPGSAGGWHHLAKEIALRELFDEAGAEFWGGVILFDVTTDGAGRIVAADVATNEGVVSLQAQAYVDSTGDGDLCALAGAGFIKGRPGDDRLLAYTQTAFYRTEENGIPVLKSTNFDAGWVDPTDPEDLTRARLLGVAQFGQAPWPQGRLLAMAPVLGLRHSRMIETDYVVELDDLLNGAVFPDAFGETRTVADSHSVDFEFESEELAFYYYTCAGFWTPLRAQLPYRMLLPRGLDNVWIACRAAGISGDAFSGLRMQRDMQRLGEAAGNAAAIAARGRLSSREIDPEVLRVRMGISACFEGAAPPDDEERWLAQLDEGRPGMHLWRLFRRSRRKDEVAERLKAPGDRTSFQAAALLAMWGDARAESRLLRALESREIGPTPEEVPVRGGWSQCIALPFWLQAVILLGRCASRRSLPRFRELAADPLQPHNVRTILATTLEKCADQLGPEDGFLESLELLAASPADESAFLPPSRSLWHTLHRAPQPRLKNDCGIDTRQDHSWQLHLVVARTLSHIGRPVHEAAFAFADDPRAFVRQTFSPLLATQSVLVPQ